MRFCLSAFTIPGSYFFGWVAFSREMKGESSNKYQKVYPVKESLQEIDFGHHLVIKIKQAEPEIKEVWIQLVDKKSFKWHVELHKKLSPEEEHKFLLKLKDTIHQETHAFFKDIPTCESHEDVSNLPTQTTILCEVQESNEAKPQSDSISS